MSESTKTLVKYGALTAGLAIASPFAPLLVNAIGLGAAPGLLKELFGEHAFEVLEKFGEAIHKRLESMETGVLGNETFQQYQKLKRELSKSGVNHDLRRGIVLAVLRSVKEFNKERPFSSRWKDQIEKLQQATTLAKNPPPKPDSAIARFLARVNEFGKVTVTDGEIVQSYIDGLFEEFIKILESAVADKTNQKLNRLFPDTIAEGLVYSDVEKQLQRLAGYCQEERNDADVSWNCVYDQVLLGTAAPGKTQSITRSFNDLLEVRGLDLRRELTAFLQRNFPVQFAEIVKNPEHRPTWIAYQKLLLETTRDQINAVSAQIKNLAEDQRKSFDELAKRLDTISSNPAALEKFSDSVSTILEAIGKGNERVIVVVREQSESIKDFLRGVFQELGDDVAKKVVKAIAASGVKPADLSQEELERELASRVPNFTADDLRRLISYAQLRTDISRIIKYAPAELIGREAETALLTDAWAKVQAHEPHRPHILTFVALGGEGKTSLVAKWAADLAHQGWPGCDAVFAWPFHSQGSRDTVASDSDLFLKSALTFLGDEGDAKFAASPADAHEKAARLARIVGRRRCILILDGLEPLQHPPTSTAFRPGDLKDKGILKLLSDLAATSHGLCIVTTRIELPDLHAFKGSTVKEVPLKRLSREAGVHLLKTHGVTGIDRPNFPHTDDTGKKEMLSEFEKLVEDVDGHALTLHIMGSFLKKAFGGDIRKRDRVTFAKASQKTDNGHAFRAMAAYARWMEDGSDEARRELAILRLMGLFDRPATADCLAALLAAPAIPGLTEPLTALPEEDWNCSLESLVAAKLLSVSPETVSVPASAFPLPASLDAHPLIREYFAERLKDEDKRMKAEVAPTSSFIPHPSSFQLAHRRLYEHLCASTQEGDQPTLEALQPLYQAVAHGCQAGLQQETYMKVYWERVARKEEYYSYRKLGAFGSDLGAVACFFEQLWSRPWEVLPGGVQAGILAQAAFYLRALGRLTESLEPMRASVELAAQRESWVNAAIGAGSLSELELTLGEVAGAVGDAEQSVTYADRSGDAGQRYSKRTTHADALHQAGRRAEAEARFREAEQMQAESQPAYPLLYSLWGFRCCDLLLAEAERAAWQRLLECASPLALWQERSDAAGTTVKRDSDASPATAPPPPQSARGLAHSKALRAVSERAAQTLKWSTELWNHGLLTIALDHLTLGRAALYAAILDSPDSALRIPHSELASAVSGLRRAGTTHHIPRGLLTRAWQRSLTGALTSAQAGPDSAQADLEEAWEIAERGPMPLFMADIHLYRARLFFREQEYPWNKNPDGSTRRPKDDLDAAENLINSCGYHRRDEELADAKLAILGK